MKGSLLHAASRVLEIGSLSLAVSTCRKLHGRSFVMKSRAKNVRCWNSQAHLVRSCSGLLLLRNRRSLGYISAGENAGNGGRTQISCMEREYEALREEQEARKKQEAKKDKRDKESSSSSAHKKRKKKKKRENTKKDGGEGSPATKK